MSIDLGTTEGRKHYLTEKLDDLLEGINDSYGTLLMEELLSRLELTVKDFNDEMNTLCDELVNKEKDRQQLLEILKTSDSTPESIKTSKLTNKSDLKPEELEDDAPEWEKKLAKLEKK